MSKPKLDAALVAREKWRIARIKTLEAFILTIAGTLDTAERPFEAAACRALVGTPEPPADWTGIDGA